MRPTGPDVNVFAGNTFVVSQRNGDIEATPTSTHGLFHMDTRFLSRLVLTVDGQRLNPLSVDDRKYDTCQFVLVPGTGTVYVDADMTVMRERRVNPDYYGFRETIQILNHTNAPVELRVDVEAKADFADLFEVKDFLEKKGREYVKVDGAQLILGYRREHYARETWIRATEEGADIDEAGLHFRIRLDPQGSWSTGIDVVTGQDGWQRPGGESHPRQVINSDATQWIQNAPKLKSSWRDLEQVYEQSIIDLTALRFFSRLTPGDPMPAAGLPWFMAIFGRDSILTSFQALPFLPDLARTTLTVLGLTQGTRIDDFRDEEPGKIVHELRHGEMTAFEERPHSPYYGTADATPLFVVLLDEYERWTGDTELVRSFEVEARNAIDWIDAYGDRDGDGYIEYQRRNEKTGLENQCWKDSWNSILYSDGQLAKLPRATCELQGYAYDAKRRAARLAREIWGDPTYAEKLEREAAALRERFNRDFWMDDKQFFALALDGDKRQVDALTSNVGHLLWSGIVDESKADAVVRLLMSPALYSGWGVRTMSTRDRGYNPVGYHIGTVWPHDSSFVACGLRRYGYKAEAARMACALLDAAPSFNMRLPEAMAGYPRELMPTPVPYPTACSPQAWASGAPLLMLRVLLGLDPVGEHLVVDPAMPTSIQRIELLGIPGRWGEADAFGRGRLDLAVH